MSEQIIANGQCGKIKWEVFFNQKTVPTKDSTTSKQFVNFRVFRTYEWNGETKKVYSFAIWEADDVAAAIAAAREAYEGAKSQAVKTSEISAIEDIF